jgi:phospholipid/cholesterol/gamma-HCH transport system ATP-binding protein
MASVRRPEADPEGRAEPRAGADAPARDRARPEGGSPDKTISVAYEGVHKRFGAKVVLDGFDLEVERSETLVLLGRSGVGKSVSLKLLLGLVRPDRGSVRFDGQELVGLSEKQMAPIRRRIGMVFQGGALFDSMTVFENVAYGLLEHLRWPAARVRARVEECLGLVDLPGVERLMPSALSGGMNKRVAIARAIATAPELLLYDEPTTGLDPATAEHVNELVRSLPRRLGVTSIIVTHDMDSAFKVADRLAVIEKGRIVWTGPAAEAQATPPEPLARFLGVEDEGGEAWRPRASSR